MPLTKWLRVFLGVVGVSYGFVAHGRAEDEAKVFAIWPAVAPGSEGKTGEEKVRLWQGEHIVSSVHRPTVTVYLPPAGQATGAAVVICPGGGHRELWMDHEGYNVARWLAAHGVAGVILKYRLEREEGSTYRVERESLADAQRAIRFTRVHAAEWGIDPARIGVMGFSAGGELASLAATRIAPADTASADPVARVDSRPAFQALIYPGGAEEIRPAKGAPPAFLLCGGDDRVTISEGIVGAYLRFHQAGVLAELHVYAGEGHGFGLRASNHRSSATWTDRLLDWLGGQGFLRPLKSKP
jgi:endo-1,4-beta-xylanase